MKKRIFALLLCVALLAGCFTTAYAAPEEDEAVVEAELEKATDISESAADDTAVVEEAEEEADKEEEVQRKPDQKSELTLDVAIGEPVETIVCDVSHIFEADEDIINANTFVFVKAAENDRFVLAYDELHVNAALYDRTTKQTWYVCPPIANQSDPYILSMDRLRSMLHLYTMIGTTPDDTVYSSVSSDAEFTVMDNGLRIDFDFTSKDIRVPVMFTLTDDGMRAEILYKEIEFTDEEAAMHLNYIEFIPYFGAANSQDDGYFVIPDGAGAVVNFNTGKNEAAYRYSKEFYGTDMALSKETDIYTSREEKINLPVYGVVKNGYSYLAEVVSGAEMATLNCEVAGSTTVGDYNVIYTVAAHQVRNDIPLMGQNGSATSVATYNAIETVPEESFAVEYHFGETAKDDYMTIATMYRDILTERGWLTQDEISDELYVDFYGAVSKKKSFLGIVYDARVTLTSFGQAKEILEDLKAGGVSNVNVQYLAYSNDTFTKDMEIGLAPSGSLGGTKAMNDLLAYAKENNISMSVSADMTTMPGNSYDFSKFKDTANVINVEPITVFPFSLNGNTVNKNKRPYYLIKGTRMADAKAIISANADTYGYGGLFFDEDAVQLYSDLAPEGLQRSALAPVQAEQYKALMDEGKEVTLSNPNAYLFACATNLVDVPVSSSKEQLFDGEIPFLQTLLRGSKNFAGESMNITDVSEKSFLQHVEYGTNIKYALISEESEALLNTEMTFLYSATYKNFAEQLKERVAKFNEFSSAVGDAKIADHSKKDGVAVTTYDNGVKVIVNYTDKAVTVDGTKVEAMSFATV